MKIFGVTVVRSEADLIAVTLRYHLRLGLDRVLVLDNASADRTDKILEQLAQGDDRIRWSRHEGHFQQAELTTGLAREACRAGADWIVPFDADEFWYAPGRAFREVLANTRAGALRAQVLHFIQAREQTNRSESALWTMTRRAPRQIGPPDEGRALVEAQQIAYVEAMYPPKWICRASRELEIGVGNHSARNLTGGPETTMELVCLHTPIRSRDTLVRKAEHGQRFEAAGWPSANGWHARRIHRVLEADAMEAEWAANSYKDDALDVYGVRRPVVFDPTLRDAVAPCLVDTPAPRSGEEPSMTPADRAEWQTAIAQNFLTNLHDDASARTEWAADLDKQLVSARKRLAELDAQVTERTEWAQASDGERERLSVALGALQSEFEERTAWALRLQRELEDARAGLLPEEMTKGQPSRVAQWIERAKRSRPSKCR